MTPDELDRLADDLSKPEAFLVTPLWVAKELRRHAALLRWADEARDTLAYVDDWRDRVGISSPAALLAALDAMGDQGQRACQHRNVRIEWRDPNGPDAPPTARGQWYRCEDCGHEWQGGHQ